MAFAAVTRAVWGTRTRLSETLDWVRVARVLKGRHAAPPGQEDRSEPGALHLEPAVSADASNDQFGHMPMQPDGSSRV